MDHEEGFGLKQLVSELDMHTHECPNRPNKDLVATCGESSSLLCSLTVDSSKTEGLLSNIL